MGKSNRIRSIRAAESVKNIGVRNKSKGMPSWLMTLITVVVAVALLFSVAGVFLSANGVFTRLTNVVVSENYKVNSNMLAYFYNTQYQNFQSNYSTYLQSGYFSIDTNSDLKEQPFGGPEDSETTYYDELFLGEFEGTWHDYFMNQAVESAKTLLMYCEAADEYGVTLSDEDMASIDESIASFESTAALYSAYYPTLNSFLSANYGKGVTEKDVRDCMELSLLASKTMEKISEEIEASVSETDINAKYDANAKDYNVVDYTYYSFIVNYDEVEKELKTTLQRDPTKDEALAEYQKQITEAKAAAAELKSKTNADDFKAYIYDYVANKNIDDTYGAQTIKDEIKPQKQNEDGTTAVDDEAIAAIKAELVKAVVAEIAEGKEEAVAITIPEDAETVEVFGRTVAKDYATVLNTVKTKLFTTVLSAKDSSIVEKAYYTADNKFSEWAFDAARVAGEINLIAEYDGETEGAEIKNEKGKSYTSVYFLNATQHKDSDTAKNFSYMVFTKEADATAAINELAAAGTLTQDAFLAKATEKSATSASAVTDYTEGNMGSTEFDKWVLDEARQAGQLTSSPIKTTSDSTTYYIVALFEGEGQELWHLDVKNTIATERAEAKVTELEAKYEITVKDNFLKFVNVTV